MSRDDAIEEGTRWGLLLALGAEGVQYPVLAKDLHEAFTNGVRLGVRDALDDGKSVAGALLEVLRELLAERAAEGTSEADAEDGHAE